MPDAGKASVSQHIPIMFLRHSYMRYLVLSIFVLTTLALSAQRSDTERRHYRPSRSFLENSDENCYEATRKEADRAFAQRCWEDASLLYRAAKNCADADQKRRQEMSDRLEACRAAAEQEIINRERHAIAANRADDSRELLRHADRSLAYRMADFANSYIAPPGEDNPDCQQAMFDAWYASPGAIGAPQAPGIQAPFCYQLGDNLGGQLIVHFAGQGKQKKIYAFSAQEHKLYHWDANTLEQGATAPIDPSITGFEVAPDGNTFLLYSDKLLIFWRKGREAYRLNVARLHNFCFSERGDEFFLLDTIEKKIDVLTLKEVYQSVNNAKMQKQRKLEETLQPPTFRPWVTGVGPGVLNLAVYKGNMWLGYADSLVVLQKIPGGQGWKLARNIPLPFKDQNISASGNVMQLYPEDEMMLACEGKTSYVLHLPEDSNEQPKPIALNGYLLASQPGKQVATLQSEYNGESGNILVYNALGEVLALTSVPDLEYYNLLSGAFDPDGQWLVLPSISGVLHCWRLQDHGQNIFYKFSSDAELVTDISPDGHCYASYAAHQISICDGRQPGTATNKLRVNDSFSTFDFFSDRLANHWIATPWRGDSMLVWNWEKNKKWWLPLPLLPQFPVAFTSDERYLAAAYSDGQIRVYDLSNGQVASTRSYSGEIVEMKFLPVSNELILLQQSKSNYDYTTKTLLRIIHPFKNEYKQRTMRLHEYNIYLLDVSSQGDLLAVSDGQDIRIFHTDDLTDEVVQIVPTGEGSVQGTSASVLAIRFSPDGRSLMTTYSDHSTVSWSTETGLPNFKLQLPAQANEMSFSRIRMLPEDNLLCLMSPGEAILIRSLDPAAIRAAVQPPNYSLIAFTPDQIRKYSLDQALNYEGNFERLANSKDIPLIKSFFSYYYQQARLSSNIDQVSEYCDRAFVLYSQLEPDTRSELRPTMLAMYSNFIWKWLLRDHPEKAEQVLQFVNKQFGKPFEVTLSEAHVALVKGGPDDLRRAVRLYADWIIRMTTELVPEVYVDPSLNNIFEDFVQLAEFELIGETQINCLCGMFDAWDNFVLCSQQARDVQAAPFDQETRLRWNIYKKIHLSNQNKPFAVMLKLQEDARADALQLAKMKPTIGRGQLEILSNMIAETYLSWARFEQSSDKGIELCRKGIRVLEEIGPFTQRKEQTRLETLARLYSDLASNLFEREQYEASLENCKKAYEVSEKMWAAVTDTIYLGSYSYLILTPQLITLGNASLMLGDFVTARNAFEEAASIGSNSYNSYLLAHVDLMEGKEIDAFLNYGGIQNTEELGNALFDLQRLSEHFPARKDSILAFMPRLKNAWLANHTRSSALEVDYRFATLLAHHSFSTEHYAQALEWNMRAMESVEQLIRNKNTTFPWGQSWVETAQNQSFYLLFNSLKDTSLLTKAIEMAQKTEEKSRQPSDGYDYPLSEYVQTNLAHAYLLRNRPGDREKAIETYRKFVESENAPLNGYWETLEKDFRDLHNAGIQWPDLKNVIKTILPSYVPLSDVDWRGIGVMDAD